MDLTIIRLRALGAVVTSSLAAVAFLSALGVAFWTKDQTSIDLLVGAVIANFTTAVSYWLGSSSGSQRKDDIISALPALPNNQPKAA